MDRSAIVPQASSRYTTKSNIHLLNYYIQSKIGRVGGRDGGKGEQDYISIKSA